VPAVEGLGPRFGCFWLNVTEAVRKRRDSALKLSKNLFDCISISVATYLESQVGSLDRSFEMVCAVDKKFSCIDVVFFSEFAEKDLGQSGRSR